MAESVLVYPDDPSSHEPRFHPPADKAATGLSLVSGTTTATVAAGAAGVRHIATGATFSLAGTAIVAGTVGMAIIDGASGGTTFLWRGIMAAGSNNAIYSTPPMNIAGSAATALTAEFSGAVTGATQAVSLSYHDIGV